MNQRLLFITGHLAEKSLARVLSSLEGRSFSYEIRVPGINVAALLTAAMLKRHPIRRITNHRRWPIQPRRNLPAVAQVKRSQPNLFHAHHPRAHMAPRFFSQVAGGGLFALLAGDAA